MEKNILDGGPGGSRRRDSCDYSAVEGYRPRIDSGLWNDRVPPRNKSAFLEKVGEILQLTLPYASVFGTASVIQLTATALCALSGFFYGDLSNLAQAGALLYGLKVEPI